MVGGIVALSYLRPLLHYLKVGEGSRKVRDETLEEKSREIPSLRETLSIIAGAEDGEGSGKLNEGGLQKITTSKKMGTSVLQPQGTIFSQQPE